mmetsp:Transcript_38873/g.103243  ORF Transcript_38873/g.103243 Transcript_38873/m.103243 type:complete len:127 (+) Transcript_38873:161-541(+)
MWAAHETARHIHGTLRVTDIELREHPPTSVIRAMERLRGHRARVQQALTGAVLHCTTAQKSVAGTKALRTSAICDNSAAEGNDSVWQLSTSNAAMVRATPKPTTDHGEGTASWVLTCAGDAPPMGW